MSYSPDMNELELFPAPFGRPQAAKTKAPASRPQQSKAAAPLPKTVPQPV